MFTNVSLTSVYLTNLYYNYLITDIVCNNESIEDILTRFSPVIVSFDYDLNFGYLYNNYDSYVQTYNFSLSGYAKIQKCGDNLCDLQLNMTGDCLSQYNSYEYYPNIHIVNRWNKNSTRLVKNDTEYLMFFTKIAGVTRIGRREFSITEYFIWRCYARLNYNMIMVNNTIVQLVNNTVVVNNCTNLCSSPPTNNSPIVSFFFTVAVLTITMLSMILNVYLCYRLCKRPRYSMITELPPVR